MSVKVQHGRLDGKKEYCTAAQSSGPALDALWKESWLRQSISSWLGDMAEGMELTAGAMAHRCEKILVVAEGPMADLLESALALLPGNGKVEVVRGTLSAGELSRVIVSMEGVSTGLIGVALEPETPAFCAVFATLRKLVADRFSREKRDRIKAIAGPGSSYLKEELERGDMEEWPVPEEYTGGAFEKTAGCLAGAIPWESAGPALLFSLMVAGCDGYRYAQGFREMLSSTWWDRDGARYGLWLQAGREDGLSESEEVFLSWQPEMAGVCRWMAAARRKAGAAARALSMPSERDLLGRGARTTTLFCLEEAADIMLPVFPGMHPEGSLNQMAKEAAESLATETGGELITVERQSAEDVGRLVAFLLLSLGIGVWPACD